MVHSGGDCAGRGSCAAPRSARRTCKPQDCAPRIIRLPPRITPSLRIATRLSSAVAEVEARVKCVSIATAGIFAGARFIATTRAFDRSSPPAFARARTSAARRRPSVRGRSRSDAEIRGSAAGAIARTGLTRYSRAWRRAVSIEITTSPTGTPGLFFTLRGFGGAAPACSICEKERTSVGVSIPRKSRLSLRIARSDVRVSDSSHSARPAARIRRSASARSPRA